MKEKHYTVCPHCQKGIVVNFEWWAPDINVEVDTYAPRPDGEKR